MPGEVFVGARFGRLEVIDRCELVGSCRLWLVRCDCGVEKKVWQQQLSNNRKSTKSCGCLAKGMASTRARKHGACSGKKASPEYTSWQSMFTRCRNPNGAGFATHGARGITICERWLQFPNFLKDMGFKPSEKHSLDRIDNNGNYEPGNCRWATKAEQSKNTRNTRLVMVKGVRMCLSDAAKELGMSRSTLRKRLKVMSEEMATTLPHWRRH
jgi:DNA-binding MarR family transcriptional regulator